MYKFLLPFSSFFSLLLSGTVLQAQTGNKFNQLLSVNQEWSKQPDVDPAFSQQISVPLNEQQLIQLHLQETEKLLRGRTLQNLSAAQKENRLKNLDVLHQYWQTGSFPINTMHSNRQPYFIDDYNTYCAVGYLMKMSGADEMAKAIHNTQNFNYLADIQHPDLMKWVEHSGLTLDELVLIQPGYLDDRPARVLEFHYNNAGTDVGEYIEIQQSRGLVIGGPVGKILFYDENGVLYKTLLLSQMQLINTGNVFNGSIYSYSFPTNENFADKGRIELCQGTTNIVNQSVVYDNASVTTTTAWYGNNIVQQYNVGESESTLVGYSLSYCGHTYGIGTYNDLTLQSLPATPGSVNPCLTLPVTLSNFSYKANKASVDLLWETATELNTAYFEIEKSTNSVDFKVIGNVTAAGFSNAFKQYTYTDNQPNYLNHYRLKQVDKDGKFSYSKILFVKFLSANLLSVIQNPVKQILQIQVNSNQADMGTIAIYDMMGRTMLKSVAKGGSQSIDVGSLAAGKYLIRLMTKDGQVYNQQFIKQ